MTSYLRSDEKTSLKDIERSKGHDEFIKSGLKVASGLATAATGAGLSSKILPFINKYIPTDMALKGINKVSPEIGSLLNKGMKQGLDIKDGLEFLKGQVEKGSQPAKQSKNIIEQESPELFQFLDQEIKNGRKPIEAAAIAQNDKRFSDIIKKLMKTHKTPWSNIIESIFGLEAKRKETLGKFNEKIKGQSFGDRELERVQSAYPQQKMQQGSPAKDQLLQAMQALSQQLQQ